MASLREAVWKQTWGRVQSISEACGHGVPKFGKDTFRVCIVSAKSFWWQHSVVGLMLQLLVHYKASPEKHCWALQREKLSVNCLLDSQSLRGFVAQWNQKRSKDSSTVSSISPVHSPVLSPVTSPILSPGPVHYSVHAPDYAPVLSHYSPATDPTTDPIL